eukprot:TRINITY_DN14695_c0_g1_i1.p1 TRINITY_DN14695_c0_g1~~TRINITY_DN14695_c0_g1_i1.p1  ORF type:complete len:457 (+),score=108.65 TRINITY_DN14695_c0_g1_i1:252-1622(+)
MSSQKHQASHAFDGTNLDILFDLGDDLDPLYCINSASSPPDNSTVELVEFKRANAPNCVSTTVADDEAPSGLPAMLESAIVDDLAGILSPSAIGDPASLGNDSGLLIGSCQQTVGNSGKSLLLRQLEDSDPIEESVAKGEVPAELDDLFTEPGVSTSTTALSDYVIGKDMMDQEDDDVLQLDWPVFQEDRSTAPGHVARVNSGESFKRANRPKRRRPTRLVELGTRSVKTFEDYLEIERIPESQLSALSSDQAWRYPAAVAKHQHMVAVIGSLSKTVVKLEEEHATERAAVKALLDQHEGIEKVDEPIQAKALAVSLAGRGPDASQKVKFAKLMTTIDVFKNFEPDIVTPGLLRIYASIGLHAIPIPADLDFKTDKGPFAKAVRNAARGWRSWEDDVKITMQFNLNKWHLRYIQGNSADERCKACVALRVLIQAHGVARGTRVRPAQGYKQARLGC